jgi:hypothetical protein
MIAEIDHLNKQRLGTIRIVSDRERSVIEPAATENGMWDPSRHSQTHSRGKADSERAALTHRIGSQDQGGVNGQSF